MNSKEKPIKVIIMGSDDKPYNFMLKHELRSDVRKESRFVEFIQYINELLS